MINLYNTEIDQLFIHKVGNKARNEEVFLSRKPYDIRDEIRPLLKEFFLKPFRDKELQYFRFAESSDLRPLVQNEFDIPYGSHHESIAALLYNKSTHPHIKAGEVYICHLDNIIVDNVAHRGLGIFKSELKYDFLEFNRTENHLDLILKQGVSLDKLDKGAIIIQDPGGKTGFRVLYVDSNKYDSKYWVQNFLNLEELEDDKFHTRNYLKFCEDFAKDVVRPAEGKQEEIQFMNETLHHFASRDEFSEDSYKNEVFDNPIMDQEFDYYKEQKGPKYSIEDLSDFAISNETVTNSMKKIKGDLVLDTGFTIKVPKGTKAASQYLEKGWDEEKQMYYYLVYFNKEEN